MRLGTNVSLRGASPGDLLHLAVYYNADPAILVESNLSSHAPGLIMGEESMAKAENICTREGNLVSLLVKNP